MKKRIRYIALLPFSILYGLVTFLRNKLFDFGILRSYSPQIPTISVGNLSVGGTGKTPHVEYLIELLKDKYKVAVLSRGYRRKTKGYLLACKGVSAMEIGDEPFQIFQKYDDIILAVDESRVHGINELSVLETPPDVILLDDAFQHRYVKAGFYVLLTDSKKLFIDDSMLPGGSLREYSTGSKRADIIVVTKCTPDLSLNLIKEKIELSVGQQLYFSGVDYGALYPVFDRSKNVTASVSFSEADILVVSGIVDNTPMLSYLKSLGATVHTLSYGDHHGFSVNDYAEIEREFLSLQSGNKWIVTTEKDAARMLNDLNFPVGLRSFVLCLPIKVSVLDNKKECFDNQILNYVAKNRRNN